MTIDWWQQEVNFCGLNINNYQITKQGIKKQRRNNLTAITEERMNQRIVQKNNLIKNYKKLDSISKRFLKNM